MGSWRNWEMAKKEGEKQRKLRPLLPAYLHTTEIGLSRCTRFGEFYSCCCLSLLPRLQHSCNLVHRFQPISVPRREQGFVSVIPQSTVRMWLCFYDACHGKTSRQYPRLTDLRRMSNALPSTSLTATVVFLPLFPPEAAAAADPAMPTTPAPLVLLLFVMLPCCFACSLRGPLNIALHGENKSLCKQGLWAGVGCVNRASLLLSSLQDLKTMSRNWKRLF